MRQLLANLRSDCSHCRSVGSVVRALAVAFVVAGAAYGFGAWGLAPAKLSTAVESGEQAAPGHSDGSIHLAVKSRSRHSCQPFVQQTHLVAEQVTVNRRPLTPMRAAPGAPVYLIGAGIGMRC